MTHPRPKIIGLVLLLPLLFGVGCDQSSAPPVALTVEELPAVFAKAFSQAKPEAKELASQIVASVQGKDYSKGYFDLQSLLGTPDLTKQQVSVTSSALLTVNTLLQAAQAQGDSRAAETIKIYRETK